MQLPTLRQLEYVVAVAESGRFVEAARRCAVSQPALSRQVAEVESLLGVQLFERVRPRVLVTEAGSEVVERSRRLLADARELVELGKASKGGRRGTVRLGVIPTIAPYGLPGLLAKLRGLFPDAAFAIQELQTEVLLERLRTGDVDVGLLAHAFDPAGLAGVDLVVEPFVLMAPQGHPLAQPKPIDWHALHGASLILMEDGHCLRDQAFDVCAAAGTPPPTSVSAASVSTLIRMVESGLGPTLVPASALPSELRRGQGVVTRGFTAPVPGRRLTLQWRQTSPHVGWYEDIGDVLRAHYLEMNASMPKIAGPRPRIRPPEESS